MPYIDHPAALCLGRLSLKEQKQGPRPFLQERRNNSYSHDDDDYLQQLKPSQKKISCYCKHLDHY